MNFLLEISWISACVYLQLIIHAIRLEKRERLKGEGIDVNINLSKSTEERYYFDFEKEVTLLTSFVSKRIDSKNSTTIKDRATRNNGEQARRVEEQKRTNFGAKRSGESTWRWVSLVHCCVSTITNRK